MGSAAALPFSPGALLPEWSTYVRWAGPGSIAPRGRLSNGIVADCVHRMSGLTLAQEPDIIEIALNSACIHLLQLHRSSKRRSERRVCFGRQHCSLRNRRLPDATDASLRASLSQPRNDPAPGQKPFTLQTLIPVSPPNVKR